MRVQSGYPNSAHEECEMSICSRCEGVDGVRSGRLLRARPVVVASGPPITCTIKRCKTMCALRRAAVQESNLVTKIK